MLGKTRIRSYKDFGGSKGTGRSIRQEDAVFACCPNCQHRHVVARWAWNRAAKPLCPQCGTLLEPGATAQHDDPLLTTKYKPEAKRRCAGCNAFLRTGNTENLCAVCQKKARVRESLP